MGKRVFIVRDGIVFITSVRDVREENAVLLAMPVSRGAPVFIEDGAQIEVGFWEANGIFSYKAVVTQGIWTDTVRMYHVKPCSRLTKLQRRENYRLPVSCSVRIRILDGDGGEFKTRTLNVSLGGACIKSPRLYERGTKLTCFVDLEGKGTVEAAGEVVHHSKLNTANEMYALGIQFTQCAPAELRRLARFMRAQEMKRRRLQ
ncbi:MAG: hypothetical protein GXY11_06565 [Clostridiales bacterium]|nr:hypothetical protein [Clostridiales bacterium]